jgi:hypothetical protein
MSTTDVEKRNHILIDFLQYKHPSITRVSERPECIGDASKSAADERDVGWVSPMDYLVHDPGIVHVLESKELRERQTRDLKIFGRIKVDACDVQRLHVYDGERPQEFIG